MIPSFKTEHLFQTWRQSISASLCLIALLALGACSSTPDKPAPKALSDFKSQLTVTPAWSSQVGPIGSPLTLNLASGRLAVVNNMGLLSVFNAETGVLAWQLGLNSAISAGVGGDGQRYAVITKANELIAVSEGKEIWRAKLPALSLTAPLVPPSSQTRPLTSIRWEM